MAETKNLTDIRVWGDLESEFWLAPKGTVLPTTWGDPTLPAFKPVGWLSEDGVTLALSTEVEKFKGYQGGTTLRTKVTAAEKTIALQALQDNPLTAGLYWGNIVTTQVPASTTGVIAPAHAKLAIPKSPGTVERVGIAKFKDDDVTKYLLMDKIEVVERGEIPHQNAEMAAYEFTFQITGDMWILTNQPAFLGV